MTSSALLQVDPSGQPIEGGREAVDALCAGLVSDTKLVIHFHGGLVDAASGMTIARRLEPLYRSAGATPLFCVWQSGLLDVLKHALPAIAGEQLFDLLLKHVIKFVVAKLDPGAGGGAKGLDGALPNEIAVHRELRRRTAAEEPYGGWPVPDLVEDLTEAERKLFLANLDADESVRESVQAIVAASDQTQNQGSRSIGTPATNPELLSPDVLAQIRAEADGLDRKGARSAFATTYIAKKALTVLAKVVRRFVVKRDHGIYPTIVEELLRELYLANVGTRVWTAMKQQTQDAFAVGEPAGAGAYFAQQLAARVRAGARPRVTLIGHSTGAVYINNLLAYLQQLRSAGQLPADFAIENVVFLAPACTFEDFGRLLEPQFFGPEHALCRRLRIYAMSDSAECADALVPGVYTRSLLYFVSGVLETSAEGAAAVDAPLVGMHRYYTLSSIYTDSAVRRLRELLTTDSMRAVWSPTQSAEAGLMSSAVRHGDFDNDEPTLESLKYLIAEGNA